MNRSSPLFHFAAAMLEGIADFKFIVRQCTSSLIHMVKRIHYPALLFDLLSYMKYPSYFKRTNDWILNEVLFLRNGDKAFVHCSRIVRSKKKTWKGSFRADINCSNTGLICTICETFFGCFLERAKLRLQEFKL